MIKAILFDCDGTLLDTKLSIFYGIEYLFKKYRPDYKYTQEDLDFFLGPALTQSLPKYFNQEVYALIDEYRSMSHQVLDKDHVIVLGDALNAIKELRKQGYKIGMVTSRANFAVEELLAIFDARPLFDEIVGFNDVTNHKPDPEAFELILKRMNIKNDEAIMIGDHYGDIQGAINAHIKSICVNWSAYGADKLLELGADYKISHFSELFDILKEV